MIKLLKILLDTLELFSDFSMTPLRSAPATTRDANRWAAVHCYS